MNPPHPQDAAAADSVPAPTRCSGGDDDAADVLAAQAGDVAAFARLYDRHAAVVLSLCRRKTALMSQSLAEAEDACQETFIRAFRKLQDVAGELDPSETESIASDQPAPSRHASTGFRSWLYAIARHVCGEQRRARRRRTHHEGLAMKNAIATLVPTAAIQRPQDDSPSLHEQLDRLTLAMQRLDDRERLAIHLHYLETEPSVAAGQLLGLSRSGYYALLQRAREKLAAAMGMPMSSATNCAELSPPSPTTSLSTSTRAGARSS